MLKNTFCHMPGIGVKTESNLWTAGILSWDHAIDPARESLPILKRRLLFLKRYIQESSAHLEKNNAAYFGSMLPHDQQWRLFPEFRGSIAYLDIETTGMGGFSDHITTIALYDGDAISYYIHGKDLDRFSRDIKRYSLVVTYNGKTFDLPFIRNYLGIPMDQAHIDLRYVLASLGYKGGLKGCEKQFGIDRQELDGVDGLFAVHLWNEYKRTGNRKSLETLLAYNIMDVVNLEQLMVLAYNLKVESTPFSGTHRLVLPETPPIPFEPDTGTIARIRERFFDCYR
jgi:uncharacterized protein